MAHSGHKERFLIQPAEQTQFRIRLRVEVRFGVRVSVRVTARVRVRVGVWVRTYRQPKDSCS